MEEKERKLSKKIIIAYAIIVAAIMGLVALIIYTVTNKKETHIYETHVGNNSSSLACTTHDNETAFFSSEIATNVSHLVKLVYKDGVVSKISYEYDGEYDSEEDARKDNGDMHAKYNIYLGEHNISHNVLTPVFQHDGNIARIRLFLDNYNNMNAVIGKLFYIGSAVKDAVGKNSIEETKKIYENKGFSCIISD